MRVVVGVLVLAVMAGGCNEVECGVGTGELDGVCVPNCGEGTVLVGDHCEAIVEDPNPCARTEPVTDPDTGVTTYHCSHSCGAPALANKQSICGQLYDFADNTRFESHADCRACDPQHPTTAGPCALEITAFNAEALAAGAAAPLPVRRVFIDTCGRFKLQEIDTASAGSRIALVVDDAIATTIPDPTGVTVTTAITLKAVEKTAAEDISAWIVKPDTANAWTGATLTTGVFAAVFYAHKNRFDGSQTFDDLLITQPGVTITKDGSEPSNDISDNDFYFDPAATTRTAITADTETGVNGTGLVDNASYANGMYTGRGGLGAGCLWEKRSAASIPGVVFVQAFRKLDVLPGQCND